MGYKMALELAGATVHEFKEFGSYQGTWLAKVTYNGKNGWIIGSYGSCSGCDAFQSEFDFDTHYTGGDYTGDYHNYENLVEGCEQCAKLREKLASFGQNYLSDFWFDQPAAEKELAKDAEWDFEATQALTFLNNNKFEEA